MPKEYSFIFVGVFLSTYINATILPLLLNGDIYGMEVIVYLKNLNLLGFVDFTNLSIFKDFTADWFAMISPYYTNMIIIGCISPLIGIVIAALLYCITKIRVRSMCENSDKEDPCIQK